jgi:uncharacterized protein YcfJ
MLRLAFPRLCLLIAGLLAAPLTHAQDAARELVVPQENVRYDYAQVLEVNPIYQVLRTTRMERRCPGDEDPQGKLSRVVGAVKGALTQKKDDADCRMVPVTRDSRRPIAFDVDYVYRGSKFRTRLAQDPGNRLRVRVSITPQPMAEP